MQKEVLVTGAGGQLGSVLKQVFKVDEVIKPTYVVHEELDITKFDELDLFFSKKNYKYCINCAAYTKVDKAEYEEEIAFNINVNGVKNLAEVCKRYGVILIHISTDFVFNGLANRPYTEDDDVNPQSIYGKTKLEGEREIQKIIQEHIIIRTSWLYSRFGNNFVITMLQLAKKKKELKVVSDQIGTPTNAFDLAGVIVKFIKMQNPIYGLYHYSNESQTSWYDFAKAIFEYAEKDILLIPISTTSYKSSAVRPKYSVLSKDKVKKSLSISIPLWRDSLRKEITMIKH